MRRALYDLLEANVKSVTGVWEPSAAGPNLELPHLVLREGVQPEAAPYADFTTLYEVWPYTERKTFQEVDRISKEVINVLNRKRFDVDGIPHFIEYTGKSTEDIVDSDWDALTRGLSFRVYSLAWLVHQPIEPDPVQAMQTWAIKRFPSLQLDPSLWNPTDATPALYWRIDSTTGIEPMNWGAWITMRLSGHVISPDLSVRRQFVDRITQGLALDANTRMSDKSKMRFLTVAADDGYDPFRDGQIKLTVKFGVLREPELYPFLKHAYFDEERGGEVHVK